MTAMSGWVGQRTCAECAYEGPEPDFSTVGLDEYGNPYVVSSRGPVTFDVLVCKSCCWVLMQMPRDRMARAIKRLLRRSMARRVGA